MEYLSRILIVIKYLSRILIVMIMAAAVLLSMVLIRDNNFYKGQAIQICNGKVETIYEKDNNHFVVCSNSSIHRLLDRK
jgi:hypothetical protein